MKNLIAIAALLALVGTAEAQLSPNPPSSSFDSVVVQSIGVNAGLTHWDNPATLGAYSYASNGTSVKIGTPDNKLGLNWGLSNAAVTAAMASLNVTGGTVRVIFTGEDAGWTDSFGYTYTGDPKSAGASFTLFDRIQAGGGSPVNTFFGQYADISLNKGAASTFDFWYSAAGKDGPGPYNPSSVDGGVYSMFTSTSNVRFAESALPVNTFVNATSTYQNVSTYLVSFEDWKLKTAPSPTTIDYSDAMFGLQFYGPDGKPFTPVPEPSTYGLIGAAALLGLVAVRRFKNKK